MIYDVEIVTFWLFVEARVYQGHPINIWLPATDYYKYFRKRIKYRMIEPHGYEAKKKFKRRIRRRRQRR